MDLAIFSALSFIAVPLSVSDIARIRLPTNPTRNNTFGNSLPRSVIIAIGASDVETIEAAPMNVTNMAALANVWEALPAAAG